MSASVLRIRLVAQRRFRRVVTKSDLASDQDRPARSKLPTADVQRRMARFEDMTLTRRRVRGPIYDLVELESEGRTFAALVFHEGYRRQEPPDGGVRAILDFLELPMVDGIAPLSVTLPGVAVYASGKVRTVREILGIYAEEGGCGARAALELFAVTAEALVGASVAARDRGLASHGSLDPWQLGVVPPPGPGASSPKVAVLGYGLPAPDVADFIAIRARCPPWIGCGTCLPSVCRAVSRA